MSKIKCKEGLTKINVYGAPRLVLQIRLTFIVSISKFCPQERSQKRHFNHKYYMAAGALRFQYSATTTRRVKYSYTSLIPILCESREVTNVAEVWEPGCGNFLLESAT